MISGEFYFGNNDVYCNGILYSGGGVYVFLYFFG